MCHSPCSFQFWNSFCLEIIIYQADTFKPLRQISLRFTKLLFLLAQDQNLLALGNRVISLPAFVGGMFKSGHFNTPPNTRPVLCRIAPCECFGDAIAAFLGHYKVGQETGSKFAPQKKSHSAIRHNSDPVLRATSKFSSSGTQVGRMASSFRRNNFWNYLGAQALSYDWSMVFEWVHH